MDFRKKNPREINRDACVLNAQAETDVSTDWKALT